MIRITTQLIIITMVFASISLAQQNIQDMVYLKNVSIIKGVVIEKIPNKSIKIQTRDGSIFVYSMDEVEKITKEPTEGKTRRTFGSSQETVPAEKGFFLDGGLTFLRINGKGKIDDEDFEVTEEIFNMSVTESTYNLDLEIEYFEGWSWKNKLLSGFKPTIGYRISPQFALMISYNYYFQKKGEKSESYNANFFDLNFKIKDEIEYSQHTTQLLCQYYPTKWKFSLMSREAKGFLLGGIEFVSLKAEDNGSFTVIGEGTDTWKLEGEDKASGLVLGSGIEIPCSSKNILIVITGMYSLTKYDGDELLEAETGAKTEMELGIGGIMVSINLRKYF